LETRHFGVLTLVLQEDTIELPESAVPRSFTMDDKPIERCDAHNLAVGPDGACVLCRRERGSGEHAFALPRRSRAGWLVGVLATACLGVAFLGGAALARGRRAPLAQNAEAPPVEVAPLRANVDEHPPVVVADAPPETVHEPAPPPVATPSPPSSPNRNYLDEAYAQLDKRGLYGDGPHAASTGTGKACTPGAPRKYYNAYYGRPPAMGVPVMRAGSRAGSH
jgi:hypothetical protein